MPGLSKVIVLDPDARAGRQLQLGFDREGVPTTIATIPPDSGRLDLAFDGAGLVIVGGTDGRALDLLRRARLALDESKVDAPIVFAGSGVRRTDAQAAGADEVVLLPAYLRDVVTIGRLMRGHPASQREHVVGSLAETTGVYTLVRALSALGRSAVLTLMRGLRRGEIRFFHGEVTSAQVGLIHGQAALHQLLLWTEARFEFHHEDVVRRQQIPMTHDELFADAERFLEGVRDSSGQLSPSMVLEQDVPRIHALGKQIPTEVHGVLRMFDGHRVLADVLEDSPYRVFETLRVAQRACDVGLLRIVEGQRPKATWRAVLSIEEWLVGSDREAAVDRVAALAESGSISTGRDSQPKIKGARRKRRKRHANTPVAVTPTPVSGSKPEIDWGALVPRTVGAEVGPLAGVVPAAHTSGEIQLPTREAPRERLEALMDTDKRTRIFPTDIGLEPKVVFDDEEDVGKANRERAEAMERGQVEAESRERKARQLREHDEVESQAKSVKAKAKSDAEAAKKQAAKEKADAEATKAKAKADAEAAKAKVDAAKAAAAARAKADADAAKAAAAASAKADADAAKAKAAAAARAKADADAAKAAVAARAQADADAAKPAAKAKADADATSAQVKADAEAAEAKAEADAAKANTAAVSQAGADGDTGQWLKAAAEAQAKAEAVAHPGSDGDTGQWLKAAAEAQAIAKATIPAPPKGAFEVKAEADAQMKSEIAEQLRMKREEAEAAEDAALRTEAAAWSKQQAAARARAAEETGREAEELAKRVADVKAKVEAEAPASDSDATTPFIRESLEIALPPVTVAESSTTTVVVQDTLTVTGSTGTAVVTSRSTATIVEAISDESSDGVVQSMGSVESVPVRPPPPPVEIPLDDRPEAKTGEISEGRSKPVTIQPALSEPSILVNDIAAAHTAVAAIASAQVAAPPTADIASPSRELAVAEVRKDAVAFSDAEEAFFRAGTEKPSTARIEHTAPVETFDDLDEGYKPLGFWDRLRGKNHPQTSPPPTKPAKKR